MSKGRNKENTNDNDKFTPAEIDETKEIEEAESSDDKADDIELKDEEPEDQQADDTEIKLKELNDKYLRLAAEFDNYRKRNARQYEYMVNAATDRILISILEVVDNLERALEAAGDSTEFKAFKMGTELIYQNLLELLKKEGVVEIAAVGEKFDPHLHEAIMQTVSDKYDEGIIAEVMLRGYKRNDRVLRHSKVIVSQGASTEDDKKDEADK